jgi:hypothetical protein
VTFAGVFTGHIAEFFAGLLSVIRIHPAWLPQHNNAPRAGPNQSINRRHISTHIARQFFAEVIPHCGPGVMLLELSLELSLLDMNVALAGLISPEFDARLGMNVIYFLNKLTAWITCEGKRTDHRSLANPPPTFRAAAPSHSITGVHVRLYLQATYYGYLYLHTGIFIPYRLDASVIVSPHGTATHPPTIFPLLCTISTGMRPTNDRVE